MVRDDVADCPKCGGGLRYYDTVRRIVRTKERKTFRVYIRRLQCGRCGALHRVIPEFLIPYKQYEADVIFGVLEGLITPETLGFEDYPAESTMLRWVAQKMQLLLRTNL